MSFKRADCVYDEMKLDADFWLPSDTSNKLRGKLTGSVSDGFRLSLEGAFFEDYEVHPLWRVFLENNEDNPEIDIILGESRKGEKYTLVNNLRLKVNRKLSFESDPQNQIIDSVYNVFFLLVGEHFNSYEEIMFESMSFGISNFEVWHLIKTFDVDYPEKDNKSFCVTYKNPEPVIIYNDQFINAKIEYTYSHGESSPSETSYHINRRAKIILKAVNPPFRLHDFEEKVDVSFSSYISKIVSFIEFATQKHIYAFDINVYSTENIPCSVYYKTDVSHELAKPVDFYDMLFNWKYIEQDPQKYFQAWIENIDKIGMPVWLYLGSFREDLYEDQRFMELAQALEGFHRYKFPETSNITEYHENRLNVILGNCPKEYRKWLSGNLGHTHEPKLPSRLKQLFNEHNELFIWLADSKTNKNIAKELIVRIRNHQAHCKSIDDSPFSSILRFHLNRYMQYVLAALLLKETNFSDEQISRIIKSNWKGKQVPRALNNALATEKKDTNT
ncbi:hypothetical protein V6x_56660 [Gimesia chilikensis]|uniref:Uncharacterized protein n=1 Tax=Gimesia chilikensis TaxID=2605989 RepID=A0A517WKZ2_9PLAN|nr:HEPN domain-containing protein [Gimesia chilikensis]QDU05922.1 hypothetical protein V6x_56660 [Gimesia chilikensis]